MANYYTNFNARIDLKGGKKAVSWVKEYLGYFAGGKGEAGTARLKAQDELFARIFRDGDDRTFFNEKGDAIPRRMVFEEWVDGGYPLGFEWKIKGASTRNPSLSIFTDMGGEEDLVIWFVQKYLKKFDPDGAWSFSWSDSCGKPRLAAFSGGAALVTANGDRRMDSREWVDKKFADLKKTAKKKTAKKKTAKKKTARKKRR